MTTTITTITAPEGDPALDWASRHPQEARAALQPPPFSSEPDDFISVGSFSSLEEYLSRRGWKYDRTEQIQLISHILSAPLTLAAALLPQREALIENHSNSNIHWLCIGARAEATLPDHIWREMLWLLPPICSCWKIDFMGPDVEVMARENNNSSSSKKMKKQPVLLEWNRRKLELGWTYRGFFDNMPPSLWTTDPSETAFSRSCVLFNPGLAHPNLRQSWKPTLDQLLLRRRWLTESDNHSNTARSSALASASLTPALMLFTAHSEQDAERDESLLRTEYGLDGISYQPNPFASRIQYRDPFHPSHFVRPNQYVALSTFQ